jgi:hypothetical protein
MRQADSTTGACDGADYLSAILSSRPTAFAYFINDDVDGSLLPLSMRATAD